MSVLPNLKSFSHATLGPAVTEVKLQHEEDLASLAKGKISHWIRLFCAALDLP
jgi:hypothetical protein